MKTYNVTKEDILKFHSWGNKEDAKELEDRFPDAFEVELIVGEWYKNQISLFRYTEMNKYGTLFGYGFHENEWFNLNRHEQTAECACNDYSKKFLVKATDLEVQTSLKNEARKRGFKKGVLIVDIYNGKTERDFVLISSDFFDWEVVPCGNKQNEMALRDSDGNIIFHNGVWADVIPTMTKQEAEEKLNCKII